jgi:hypothetical protein
MDDITPFQWVTLGIAIGGLVSGLIGTILSSMNTWRAFDRDRVKLRVEPMTAYPVTGATMGEPMLSIKVTNLSHFPVTITHIGFLFRDRKKYGPIIHPLMYDGGAFPRLLEPRTHFSVYVPEPHTDSNLIQVRAAFAETACGVRVEGTGAALSFFSDEAAKPRAAR